MAALAGVAGMAAVAGVAGAQDWRTLESSRQLRGDAPAVIRVEYAAGTLDLRPTNEPILYRMRLRYDADRSTAISGFDAETRTVTFGSRSARSVTWRRDVDEGNALHAKVTRAVPVRLILELGATRGDLTLGGLRLSEFTLRAGASETFVEFDAPNRESPAVFDLDVGAARVTVRGGGNARARKVHANIGAGALDYDLSGDWSDDVDFSVNVAVGTLTVRVPPDAGVRVTARTFLAGFGKAGLERRGDAWVSPGFERAGRRVRIDATVALGGIDIVRR
jgi:hypothetical protein